jgi:hypothetical protein
MMAVKAAATAARTTIAMPPIASTFIVSFEREAGIANVLDLPDSRRMRP